MNPIYKFMLSVNGGQQQEVKPYYNDLSKEWQKESDQAFFRATLSGKLTFVSTDYDIIHNGYLDDLFELEVLISYDNSSTWNNYWNGYFYKVDCEINETDKHVIVTPHAKDEYDAILNALDKEIDLIPAAPRLVPVGYYKRPVVQFYVAGQSVIGCYLDGMYWEQACNVVTDAYELNNTYKLGLLNSRVVVYATGAINDFFWGNTSQNLSFDDATNTYRYQRHWNGSLWQHSILEISSVNLLYNVFTDSEIGEIILQPVSGSGATGTVTIDVREMNVYARLICDVEEYTGVATEVLPDDDITETTYHRSVALNQASYGSIIVFSSYLTSTPTQWGIYKPNQYYGRMGDNDIPMARNSWGRISIWLNPYNLSIASPNMFEIGAKEVVCKDCYPIESVLSVMFSKLGLSLTYQSTAAYSQFFYGDTTTAQGIKVKNVDYNLYLTQKSNILKGEYDEPAQKAIITLREIFDMFKKCFKVYWFVENGKLRLEHIYWFMNGGSYSGTPIVDRDLTTELLTRNGKPLDYAQNSYTYDKPDTVGQYQFAWMDDVTIPFKGEPIKIISPYVQQSAVDNVDVAKFTTDIDYMQAAPNECSKDGFALLACVIDTENITINVIQQLTNPLKAGDIITSIGNAQSISIYPTLDTSYYINVTRNMLPYIVPQEIVMIVGNTTITVRKEGEVSVPFVNNPESENKLQNGYLSFWYLQRYYDWNMPAPFYLIGDSQTQQIAKGVKRLKTQTIDFLALNDIDTKKLIKTNIGNGQIEKISINLSDRNARVTLKFDENPNE